MTCNRWTHPDCDEALILDPAEFHDPVHEKVTAKDHLCPDDNLSKLKCEPVEMTPEAFAGLREFQG